jgi:hypothetical protein
MADSQAVPTNGFGDTDSTQLPPAPTPEEEAAAAAAKLAEDSLKGMGLSQLAPPVMQYDGSDWDSLKEGEGEEEDFFPSFPVPLKG